MNFDEFPTGIKRKRELQYNGQNIRKFEKEGLKKILTTDHYMWIDSPLEGSHEPGKSFDWFFAKLIPRTETLRSYIEKILESKNGKAVGVEFGGPGLNVFKGFTPGFFKSSVGITLVNHIRPDISQEQKNHTILEGDVLSDETYEKLNSLLNDQKVDLILERMAKGLEFIPKEPYKISKIISKWYKMLNEGGIMFIQVPIALNELFGKWVKMIETEHKTTIEITYSNQGTRDSSLSSSVLCLRKLPGAPEDLPLLDPRTVFNTPRVKESR